jgi:hypothetical protein
MPDPTDAGLLKWGISILVPAISGLSGVAIGAFLTTRRETINRKYKFIERQLTDFYSPLLAIRMNLKAGGELRLRISNTADSEWRKLCARFEGQPDELRKLSETRGEKFSKIIDYNNEKLKNEDIPAYHKMIEIIQKNMWLAEKSTLEHFPKLIEFVDLWDRFLKDSLPGEVVQALDHSEKSLHPLYEDLQQRHDELRAKLSEGKI